MLQDLDSLAARVGQMVRLVRQLQADRETLQSRLKRTEQERDGLRGQVDQYKADHQAITARLDGHMAEVEAVRAQADKSQADLRDEVLRYRAEHDALKQALATAQGGAARLQAVAGSAKERIDTLLMRLPGAPQE